MFWKHIKSNKPALTFTVMIIDNINEIIKYYFKEILYYFENIYYNYDNIKKKTLQIRVTFFSFTVMFIPDACVDSL